MKIFLFISVLLLVFNFSHAQSSEKKILDTIWKLIEVKNRAKYVERQTKGKRKLKLAIWQQPTKSEPFYWIKVMENNGITNYTHFNFIIYPKDMSVKYYDTVNDTLLNLKTWRLRKY